jgi:hypothetical protein
VGRQAYRARIEWLTNRMFAMTYEKVDTGSASRSELCLTPLKASSAWPSRPT